MLKERRQVQLWCYKVHETEIIMFMYPSYIFVFFLVAIYDGFKKWAVWQIAFNKSRKIENEF